MGKLIEGQWTDKWYDTKRTGGRFVRRDAAFRNWITADGSAGPTGAGGFEAEGGRYHLYVSLACPWAHRTLIFRKIKQLEALVDLTIVDPLMMDQGWSLESVSRTDDPNADLSFLYQIYQKADAQYTGRVTVPVLWDKKRKTIVNNESSELIRMFNSEFNHLTGDKSDFYPASLRPEIDAINTRIYHTVNNGVYRAGFATTQAAYEEAVLPLFDTLDWLDDRLKTRRYLMGKMITEADWRLFTTLVRFDCVYYSHFKCNLNHIWQYEHLSAYLRELYQLPGIAETVNFEHIKRHYFVSHPTLNPSGIVPVGPQLRLNEAHRRDSL